MKKTALFPLLILIFLTLLSCRETPSKSAEANTEKISAPQRIVSLNGGITEIVYDLGYGKNLVGRDATSAYPEWVKDSVTDLGVPRSISVESILKTHPDLVLATRDDVDQKLEKSLKNSGIPFHLFDREFTVEGTKELITTIAQIFKVPKKAEVLHQQIKTDLKQIKPFKDKPKVLFIYARGAGTLLVSGKDTQMDELIQLAGAKNAIQNFKDFKPLTEEALLESNPDVILLFDSGLQSLSGIEGITKVVPALSQTKAGKQKAILAMDGTLLSSFGPRLGEAVLKLNQALHQYGQ